MKLILALDQGTTGSQALLFQADTLELIAQAKTEFPQLYPRPGWVEHSPKDIWNSQVASIAKCFEDAKLKLKIDIEKHLIGLGITNQRETIVPWNAKTFLPLHNALVWQDRRTAQFCQELKTNHEEEILSKTGLTVDPYFSSSKMHWLLQNCAEVKEASSCKQLQFGTIDAFLVMLLSGGKLFVTDHTNASRTQLYNLNTNSYDSSLLNLFKIPEQSLPKICTSLNSEALGHTASLPQTLLQLGFLASPIPHGTPIFGALGDQQAALFGQGCTSEGESKITFGTGAFLLLNVGNKALTPPKGLLSTVALSRRTSSGKESISYAFEGSCFIAGAAVQFLRDNFGWIKSSSEIESLANKDPRDENLIFIPSLAGLGAPYWNARAKGTLFGLTRGSTQSQMARCVVESIALQNASLVRTMQQHFEKTTGKKTRGKIGVDGGASQNNSLMQFQSNILQCELHRPHISEATGLGAAKIVSESLNLEKAKNTDTQNKLAKEFLPNEDLSRLLKRWEHAANAVNEFYKTFDVG
jgi:glycerol kinase